MGGQLAKLETTGNNIDTIVTSCLPLTTEAANFVDAMTIASGVSELRNIFLNTAEIKRLIEAMKGTQLGFLTDKEYSYPIIVEAIVEGLLKGYRITGNEINIIAGRFYAAKNGKYRKIIEKAPDFQFSTTPPRYEMEEKVQNGKPVKTQVGFVSATGNWTFENKKYSIGIETHDPCHIKIKVNNFMGDDAITGKAESKLFTKILSRLNGRPEPYADMDDAVDITPAQKSIQAPVAEKNLTDKLKNKKAQPKKTTAPPEPEPEPMRSFEYYLKEYKIQPDNPHLVEFLNYRAEKQKTDVEQIKRWASISDTAFKSFWSVFGAYNTQKATDPFDENNN